VALFVLLWSFMDKFQYLRHNDYQFQQLEAMTNFWKPEADVLRNLVQSLENGCYFFPAPFDDPYLVHIVGDDSLSDQVRSDAAASIKYSKLSDYFKTCLFRILRNPKQRLRDAVRAIVFSNRQFPALLRLLDDRDPQIVESMLHVFQNLVPPLNGVNLAEYLFPKCIELCRSPSSRIRAASLKCIQTNWESLPPLSQVLEVCVFDDCQHLRGRSFSFR
jgi:hypothetical protein